VLRDFQIFVVGYRLYEFSKLVSPAMCNVALFACALEDSQFGCVLFDGVIAEKPDGMIYNAALSTCVRIQCRHRISYITSSNLSSSRRVLHVDVRCWILDIRCCKLLDKF
jgi:hypothetical protein